MRKTMLLLVAAVALAAPGAAAAKGASKATIDGPGLGGTLTVGGNGESGGTPLGNLGQYSGFFPAVFGQSPDPTATKRPAGKLGPRYRIVWTVPGPNGDSTIRQDVYPYAQPDPVTYMKPGQEFWDGQKTHGGWYVGDSMLRSSLTAAGVPPTTPDGRGADWSRWLVWALAAAAALGAAALLARRRTHPLRPEPAR
jgi:hypothetical protein